MTIFTTSLVISLIAALWVWIEGRKDPHGRPWLTALCMVMLLVLPLFTLLPKIHWEVPGQAPAGKAIGSVVTSQVSIESLLLGLWLAGAVLMVVRLCYRQRSLAKWINKSTCPDDLRWDAVLQDCCNMLGVHKLPEVRVKRELSSPVVAGWFNPVVLLPAQATEWSEQTLRMALLHELGHIRRKDLWVRMLANFTCAVYWYNPMVWWMRSRLFSQCEYACDALVITSGADPKNYISALCDVVEATMRQHAMPVRRVAPRAAAMCGMADHAPLRLRVQRLLGGQRLSRPWLAVAAAVLTVSTALGMSLVRPVVREAKPEPAYSLEEIGLRHTADPFPGNL